MYLASLALMQRPSLQRNSVLFLPLYWFNLMNVANFYAYVPIRTFVTHGDIAHNTQGLGLQPWVALIILGIPTAIAIWWLFAHTLPLALKQLAPHSPFRRGLIVTLSTVIIFGYFGLAGWTGYGATSHALSAASPVVLILCLILRLRALFLLPFTGESARTQ